MYRTTDPRSRRQAWTALVPLAALLAGVLFASTATTARGADLRPASATRVSDLVTAEQRRVEGYDAQARALRADVQASGAQAAVRDDRVAAARAAADAIAPAAGLVAVSGPAVTVILDDAPRTSDGTLPGRASPDDLVVHQQDVQAVVNALWVGGGEAMALMDQRVTATSAVRCVGNTLLLHGAVYSPPFTITAIGDVDGMRTALERAPGVVVYRQYVAAYGLGYSVTSTRGQRLPAYDGPLTLTSARPT